MDKLTKRQIQAQNTKQHILNVAYELLKHKTLDEISIKEICTSANISIGAFYHHFENKESIFIEFYKDIDKYFEETIIPKLIKEDPINAILDYLSIQCQHALNTGIDFVKNTYKAQINNATSFILSESRPLPNGLSILIQKAKDTGKIRSDLSVNSLTCELLIISRGCIYYWCISNGTSPLIETVRKMASNYLKSCA